MIPLFSLPYLIFECFSVKFEDTTSDNVISILETGISDSKKSFYDIG